MPPSPVIVNGAFIDPAYLLFHAVYVQWWTEGKNPHNPRLAEIETRMKEMNREERAILVSGARLLAAYGEAMGTFSKAVEKFAAESK